MKLSQILYAFLGLFIGTSIAGFYINDGYSDNPIYLILGLIPVITGITLAHAEKEITRVRDGIHYDIAFIRGIVAILLSLAITYYIIPYFNKERFILTGAITIYILSIFFLEFDYFYNWFKGRRGKDLLYRGTEALTDKVFYNHPYVLLAVKVVLFIGSFIILNKILLWHS